MCFYVKQMIEEKKSILHSNPHLLETDQPDFIHLHIFHSFQFKYLNRTLIFNIEAVLVQRQIDYL